MLGPLSHSHLIDRDNSHFIYQDQCPVLHGGWWQCPLNGWTAMSHHLSFIQCSIQTSYVMTQQLEQWALNRKVLGSKPDCRFVKSSDEKKNTPSNWIKSCKFLEGRLNKHRNHTQSIVQQLCNFKSTQRVSNNKHNHSISYCNLIFFSLRHDNVLLV